MQQNGVDITRGEGRDAMLCVVADQIGHDGVLVGADEMQPTRQLSVGRRVALEEPVDFLGGRGMVTVTP